MRKLLQQNKKLKKDGIFNFDLPAIMTCPAARACKEYCYATQCRYTMKAVKRIRRLNLNLTKSHTFISRIDTEINKRLARAVRIHSSGDFYSSAYLNKWIEIAHKNPQTLFYAYTKRVALFKNTPLPANFRVIFSYGGTEDNLITERDVHSRIFKTREDLIKAGYTDCSKSDAKAWTTRKVGLIYHGVKKFKGEST